MHNGLVTRRARNLLAFLAACTAVAAAPTLAHAHGRLVEGVPVPAAPDTGSVEANLRKVETEGPGPEHAAVHAQQRAIAEQQLAGEQAHPQAAAQARAVSVAATPPVVPATVGSWSSEINIPVIAINAIMIPKGPAAGKILMFAYPGRPGFAGSGYVNLARAYLWDPVSQTSEPVDPPIDPATGKPTNIWCSGASVLADGRVLVTGGNVGDPTADYFGLNTVFTFDPVAKKWQREPPMRQGRWYPSQLLMPDARTLIMAGKTAPSRAPGTLTPTDPGYPGDPDFHQDIPTRSGEFRNSDIETFSPDSSKPPYGSIERDDLQLGQPGAPSLTGLYPHMFWTPSGRALVAGPQKEDSWYVDPGRTGQPTAWTDVPNLLRDRNWGTSVLVGSTVWMLGGSPNDAPLDEANHGDQPASSSVEALDDAKPGAGWVSKPAMKVARSHANSVLLPDGKVATIGGGYGNKGSRALYRWIFSDEQKQVELLDPSSGQSTLGAAQVEGRSYHSTALLLPDGRVFSAGDDINGKPAATDDPATSWDETRGEGTGASSDTAEIYSPPYLFKSDGSPAPRPVLDDGTLPAERLGADFEVSASGEPATKAVLVAPGAATHAVDMSQRLVNLAPPVAGSAGHLKLHVPSDPNRVLPGYYMLFLLSADGVPSKAKFIQIEAPPDTTAPAVSLTAPAGGSSSADTTPTYAGTAGNLAGDRSTVTLRVYAGSTATGTPVQTRTTPRSGTSWTVDGSPPLSAGTYTARAEQSDYTGNTGLSTAITFTIPGPPAPPAAPAPPAPSSPSKPTLTITGALPKLRTLKRTKRFRLTVVLSEPGTVTLQGRLERGTHQAKTLVRQRKVTFSTVRRRRVTFKLTRAGLRLLAHRRRGVVRIRATSLLKSGHTLPRLQVRRKLR